MGSRRLAPPYNISIIFMNKLPLYFTSFTTPESTHFNLDQSWEMESSMYVSKLNNVARMTEVSDDENGCVETITERCVELSLRQAWSLGQRIRN